MSDFESVYNAYFDDVYRYMLRLSGDSHIAEEITADAFFRAMRAIDSFRGDCDIRVWLTGIARNRYLTYIRHARRTESLDAHDPDTIPDNAEQIDDAYARRETTLAILKIAEALEEPHREVFFQRIYGELSFREIGALFGKTENWACVTYHRAAAKIRKEMEDHQGGN